MPTCAGRPRSAATVGMWRNCFISRSARPGCRPSQHVNTGCRPGLTLEEQRYIHCSLHHQLRGVAELVYGDADGLVVLVIDSAKVPAPVRYEVPGPGAEEYPYLWRTARECGDRCAYRADLTSATFSG